MNERYSIQEVHICTFSKLDKKDINGYDFITNMNDYPLRWCVIDYEKEFVIDIKMKLMYKYVDSNSNLKFLNELSKVKKDNKRAAIRPIYNLNSDLDMYKEGNEIIENLKNGYEYPDGNDVYNNKEYLEKIKEEELEKQKSTSKVKQKVKKWKK